MDHEQIVAKIKDTVVTAGSTFTADKIAKYEQAIKEETNENAAWVLKTILKNAKVAEKLRIPLCDDTGIPHVFIELGKNRSLSGAMMESIRVGIKEGLQGLPGRPMAIKGNDLQRVDQSGGLDTDPGAVELAPMIIKDSPEDDLLRVHVLLLGGGPAIRGKTQRIFHRHDLDVFTDEIVEWATEGVAKLGCQPCTLAIGVGRSQFEATSLMMEAQVFGNHMVQNELEETITRRVNEAKIGPLNLGGDHSVLATFMKIGPQRASGIRVVSVRPNCNIEPRIARVDL